MPLLNAKTEIDDSRPLPHLDGPFAKAYAAKGKSDALLVAYVCTAPVAVRVDMVAAMRGVNHASLSRVRDNGTLEWPHSGGRAYAFVYDMPAGPRLAPPDGGAFPALRDEQLSEHFLQPLITGLNELGRVGVFHGGVRAANIFMEPGGKAVLGDGMAVPAGSGQPVIYETVDRGMAEGAARGAGSSADDFYALGVALLSALAGQEPLQGMSASAVVNLKLERGSYAALAGERRFSPAMVEVLRGLLADDPRQRWTFADYEMWADGKRLTPKQSMPSKKASRAFVFNGQSYMAPRQLALAMAGNVPLAVSVIQNEELGRWLKNGLGDEAILKSYDEARLLTKRQRVGPEDERLVANVVMALDPRSPIRYRGIAVFPGGIAANMAQAVLNDAPLAPYIEMIINDMPDRWLQGQVEKKPDMVGLVQQVQRVKDLAEKPGLGFGPERALYEINPSQPCLSPVMRSFYVMGIQHLLESYDRRGGLENAGGHAIDRHVAAFILARDRKVLPQIMRTLESAGDPMRRGQGVLTLFADLQYRTNTEKLRALAKSLLPLADETVRRFQNRPRQGKIRESLRPAVEAGSIPAMLGLVDNPDMLTLDAQEYHAARLLYRETEAEIGRLGGEGADKKILAEQAGQPLAAALSVGLGFVLAAFLLLRAFLSAIAAAGA